jgi:hypothetical protein
MDMMGEGSWSSAGRVKIAEFFLSPVIDRRTEPEKHIFVANYVAVGAIYNWGMLWFRGTEG